MVTFRIIFLCLTLLGVFGCYTFTGTTLPGHLKTIQIEPVINQTRDPVLAEKLTQSIISGFQSQSALQAVNENGDCRLTTKLTLYKHDVYNTSGSEVVDYRVDVAVDVVFSDQIKGKVLFQEENLPGFGTYSVRENETELVGQQRAIDNIVEIVLDNTISGW